MINVNNLLNKKDVLDFLGRIKTLEKITYGDTLTCLQFDRMLGHFELSQDLDIYRYCIEISNLESEDVTDSTKKEKIEIAESKKEKIIELVEKLENFITSNWK